MKSPLSSINSDLYDELQPRFPDYSKMHYLEKLRGQLLYEPNCLNFDSNNAMFILATLILTEPFSEYEKEGYRQKRNELFQMVRQFTPVAVSFQIDEMKCKQLLSTIQNSMRYVSRFRDIIKLFEDYSYVAISHQPNGSEPKAIRFGS